MSANLKQETSAQMGRLYQHGNNTTYKKDRIISAKLKQARWKKAVHLKCNECKFKTSYN